MPLTVHGAGPPEPARDPNPSQPPAAPSILVLADGRQVPAKKISIASVRVGKFTVENVEGAVLPPQLTEAPPLLGMSFLGNFRFDIDPSAKKLTMTLIEGGDVPAPKKGASDKSGVKSRKWNVDVPDIVE